MRSSYYFIVSWHKVCSIILHTIIPTCTPFTKSQPQSQIFSIPLYKCLFFQFHPQFPVSTLSSSQAPPVYNLTVKPFQIFLQLLSSLYFSKTFTLSLRCFVSLSDYHLTHTRPGYHNPFAYWPISWDNMRSQTSTSAFGFILEGHERRLRFNCLL